MATTITAGYVPSREGISSVLTTPILSLEANSTAVSFINTTDVPPHPNADKELPSVEDHDRFPMGESEQQRGGVTLSDTPAPGNPLPPPPKYHKEAQQTQAVRQTSQKAPDISLNSSRSESNLLRAFSLRRSKSNSKALNGGDMHQTIQGPKKMHSRNHSMTYSGDKLHSNNGLAAGQNGGLQRSMSKRQKFVRAITNPDTIFKQDPASPPPESRFNPNPNSKLARTFFGSGRVDFASGAPLAPIAPLTPPTPLPDADLPLFNPVSISEKVLADLPVGYTMRPLCRSDYQRGYLDVLRVIGRTGWVSEDLWDERCEWLRSQGSTYFILVVVNEQDRVIASGTCLLERKFVHNMGVVGHIEDLAVARDQKGKKMGLRVLEALVHVARSHGCYKTMVNCAEANEAFHAQTGFVREGSQMVLHEAARRPPQAEHWV